MERATPNHAGAGVPTRLAERSSAGLSSARAIRFWTHHQPSGELRSPARMGTSGPAWVVVATPKAIIEWCLSPYSSWIYPPGIRSSFAIWPTCSAPADRLRLSHLLPPAHSGRTFSLPPACRGAGLACRCSDMLRPSQRSWLRRSSGPKVRQWLCVRRSTATT